MARISAPLDVHPRLWAVFLDQQPREVVAAARAQLAIRIAQGQVDGLWRDEQRLADRAVGLSGRGALDDAPLRRRQCGRASQRRRTRAAAGGVELMADAPGERVRVERIRELERAAQRVARLRGPAGGTQDRALLGQRLGELQAGGGATGERRGLAQALRALLDTAQDPQRPREDRRRAPAARDVDLLGGELERLIVPAEVTERDGRVRVPRRVDRRQEREALHGGSGDDQGLVVLLLGEQLLDQAVEPVARAVGGVAAVAEGLQLASRAGDVAPLAADAGQPGGGLDGAPVPEAPKGVRLDRVAQRGLGVREVAVAIERVPAVDARGRPECG